MSAIFTKEMNNYNIKLHIEKLAQTWGNELSGEDKQYE